MPEQTGKKQNTSKKKTERQTSEKKHVKTASQQPQPAAANNSAATVHIHSRSNVFATVIGVTALLMIAGLFFMALMSAFKGTITAPLTVEGNRRAGAMQKFQLSREDLIALTEGDEVNWYIDGVKVQTDVYGSQENYQLQHVFDKPGKYKVRVDLGNKMSRTVDLEVTDALVEITADSFVVVYGDKLPELTYKYTGVEGSLKQHGLTCEVTCGCGEHPVVGTYPIKVTVSGDCCTEVKEGTLQVVPRPLKVMGLIKEYDGTTEIDAQNVILDNVVKGDDVSVVKTEKLKANSKNAGTQSVDTSSVHLTGKKASNYVVESGSVEITPKPLYIKGLHAQNKMYDGTKKVTVAGTAQLEGVIDGDNVTVGGYTAQFTTSDSGTGKSVRITDLTLVGADKDNYTVRGDVFTQADVVKSFWDVLDGSVHG